MCTTGPAEQVGPATAHPWQEKCQAPLSPNLYGVYRGEREGVGSRQLQVCVQVGNAREGKFSPYPS